jgi:hypothetical protein
VTLRVRPTPERPLSPWMISTVSHRPDAIAAAAWRTWIMNDPRAAGPAGRPGDADRGAVDPFRGEAQVMRDRHRSLACGRGAVDLEGGWVDALLPQRLSDRHRSQPGGSSGTRGMYGNGTSSPVTGSVMPALRMRLIGEPAIARACGRRCVPRQGVSRARL